MTARKKSRFRPLPILAILCVLFLWVIHEIGIRIFGELDLFSALFSAQTHMLDALFIALLLLVLFCIRLFVYLIGPALIIRALFSFIFPKPSN